jgi:DNA polymerase-4
VEQLDDPALRGRPVVVGGSAEGRGVVAAASYEARAWGVRSAQPMRTALRLCPGAVRVPPRFDRYHEVSGQVFAVFRRWTPLVQPLSLDEAYLDLTALLPDATPKAMRRAAARLKREVREATGLTLSVGAAGTKSGAKIGSDLQKPDGLVVVPPGTEREFLAPLPIGKLWGVGPRTEARLRRIGVRTIGEMAALDTAWVAARLGNWGVTLHALALGVDLRPVEPDQERKQVSQETTFAQDVADSGQILAAVDRLAVGVCERLRRHGLRGRTVAVKLRDAGFETHTRQLTLPAPSDDPDTIDAAARRLMEAELRPGRRLRLVGVAVSGFADSYQLALPL